MNFIEASVIILFLAIVTVPLAKRFHLPLEIFLVIGSGIVGLIPGLPIVRIDPVIVFKLFLPPILFYAAYFTSWQEFKKNIRPISLLAFGLVIFTTVLVAVVAHYLIPGFSWGMAFILGAILSPTDASSSVAIIKKLGAHRRIVTILEGESLVNDATALILFRFSLAAVLLGTYSISDAILNFFLFLIGGALVGFILGYIAVFILRKINDSQAETTFTFIIAFASYLLSEQMHCSGVIATVVCGIYFGRKLPIYAASETKITAKSSWKTLIFVVNGFVFTLIGLQLPQIIKDLKGYSIMSLIQYSVIIILAVIVSRLIWVYPAAYLPRKLIPPIGRRDPMPPLSMLFIIGWTGMRGIVSFAAALSIPFQIQFGVAFPNRNLILFLTYCVVVATLFIPTLTLPFLIPALKLTEDPSLKLKEEASARIRALEGVIDRISELVKKEKIPNHLFEEFRKQIERRLEILRTQLDETPYSTLNKEYSGLKKLALTAIASEKETLNNLRKSGEIRDEIFHKLSDELDLEEVRARSIRL